jgi:hypothetical protein
MKTNNISKNHIARLMMVLFVFLISCDTDHYLSKPQIMVSISPTISVNDDIVSFKSIQAYTDLIDNQDAFVKMTLVQKLDDIEDYRSFKQLKIKGSSKSRVSKVLSIKEEELIDTNDFITTLLNSDGMLRIGNYLFKINLAAETCLVVDGDNEEDVADLISENTTNKKIMIFSTSDDVLYLLAEGSKGTISGRTELFCTQSGAPAKEDKGFDYESDRFRMDNKVVYQKVAVYFSLQAKTKIQYRSDLGVWVDNTDCNQRIRYFYRIKPKCRDEFEKESFLEDDGCGNELNLRPYERSYGLNKYWYATIFFGYSFWSRDYEIRYGF